MTPVVLDIDGSVGPLPGALVLPLQEWQEALRFGCRQATLSRFGHTLDQLLPARHGTVLLGSGDFHHLSWPLIERIDAGQPFQVVVLDNHPDNMRYAFGVHCGSWVRRVAMLPQVSHVHVLGISSNDVGRTHAWENHLGPLRSGRLSYWCLGVDVGWAKRLRLDHAFHAFDDPQAMVEAFRAAQAVHAQPTYLSIDKDVFAPHVARTNWDQGRLELDHARALIDGLRGPLIGSDITGDISHYRYRSWLKRRLSAIDAQPAIDASGLAAWQAQQHAVNLELLAAIAARALPVF
jgi:hypothetical protein